MEGKKKSPEAERLLDQMLYRFQSLLLTVPERDNQDRKVPQAPAGHKISNEIYDILRLPWRQRVPTDDDCAVIVKYFNLTMEIMEDIHRDHATVARNLKSEISKAEQEAVGDLGEEPAPRIPTTYQEYIFNCSMCYDMFSMLYVSISSEHRYTPSEADDMPPMLRNWKPSPGQESGDDDGASVVPLASDRPTSSPIPNLPSTSQQNALGAISPAALDPNMPSTSSYFSFHEAAQLLAMDVGAAGQSARGVQSCAPVRNRNISRMKKDKKDYQRRQKKPK